MAEQITDKKHSINNAQQKVTIIILWLFCLPTQKYCATFKKQNNSQPKKIKFLYVSKIQKQYPITVVTKPHIRRFYLALKQNNMSLLDKAKADISSARQTITEEHIELARAFINQEIGISAINRTLGYTRSSPQGYITICRALREENMQRISKL